MWTWWCFPTRKTKLPLPCVRRYDLEVDADMVVCQLTTSKTRCLLLAVFYRPPNAGESFLESFKNSLEKASVTGIADLVITGDFNFPCTMLIGLTVHQPLLIIQLNYSVKFWMTTFLSKRTVIFLAQIMPKVLHHLVIYWTLF